MTMSSRYLDYDYLDEDSYSDMIEYNGSTYIVPIEWKTIVIDGKASHYEVSTLGDVRNKKLGKVLKPFLSDKKGKDGSYYMVSIYIDKELYKCRVHRLVAEAFIPDHENKPQVNHINGDKLCNILSNLEWATESENVTHVYSTGLAHALHSENHGKAIHTNKEIKEVCKLLEDGYKPIEITLMTDVPIHTINDIKTGKSWKHISKNYNIKHKKHKSSRRTINIEKDKKIKEKIYPLIQDRFTYTYICKELGMKYGGSQRQHIKHLVKELMNEIDEEQYWASQE